jgi:hypothetical protein
LLILRPEDAAVNRLRCGIFGQSALKFRAR